VKSWIIAEASAEFVCQMEQILAVYQRPYSVKHPVVCLDESPKQLISEVRRPFTDKHGIDYIDYEYARQGVVDMYMIVEPLAGRRQVRVEDNHNRFTYAQVVAHIAEKMYPKAEKITLVEDNLSAHKLSALYEIFPPAKAQAIMQRLEVVRTPVHGSWLNIAECELSVLTRQALSKRIADKQTLIKQVQDWYEQRNDKQIKVNWQFKTKDARIKLKRLYPKIIT
jgi:hypothetical protein